MTRKAGVNGSAHTAQQRDRSLTEVRALLHELRGTHNAPPRAVPMLGALSPDMAIQIYREARDDLRRVKRVAEEQAYAVEAVRQMEAREEIRMKGGRPRRMRGLNVERDPNG